MHVRPNNHMYDNRHTSWYNDTVQLNIEIHPHAIQTHHLTREQIESAFNTRIGSAKIRPSNRSTKVGRYRVRSADQTNRTGLRGDSGPGTANHSCELSH